MLVRLFDNTDGPLLIDVMRETRQRSFTRVTGFDSLHAPTPVSRPSDVKLCSLGDVLRIFPSPFSPMPLTVPAGDGVVQSDADGRYRLLWHDARGQLRRITERVAGRAPVTDEAFLAANADWQRFSDSTRSPGCEGELVRYAEKPSIRALLPDPEGRLWVEQQRSDGVFYEIWSGDSLVAQLPAPARVATLPPAMFSDRLAVVGELPDGGHEVRLFRITREAHVGAPRR